MEKSTFVRIYMFPFNRVHQGSKIVIWGKGYIGTQYYKELKSMGYAGDIKWVDTDSIKDEQSFLQDNIESFFVIAVLSDKIRQDITLKLINNGVAEKYIINDKPHVIVISPHWCAREEKNLNDYSDEIQKELKRFFELIKIKTALGYNYVRVGAEHDGGYVMLDDLPGGIAYSFGINDDVSWDDNMTRYGYEVYMYDHTIDGVPYTNKAFHFFREGIADYEESDQLKKLETFINHNNHAMDNGMILKIDVEGAEWGVFENVSDAILKQFNQIVVEFHGLCDLGMLSKYNNVLKKINRTHQPVHYHINNCGDVYWFDDKPYGNAIEITFANREKYKFVDGEIKLPRECDAPNCKDLDEIVIGNV